MQVTYPSWVDRDNVEAVKQRYFANWQERERRLCGLPPEESYAPVRHITETIHDTMARECRERAVIEPARRVLPKPNNCTGRVYGLRNCTICGEEFAPVSANQVTCGKPGCQKKQKASKTSVNTANLPICALCNKPFHRTHYVKVCEPCKPTWKAQAKDRANANSAAYQKIQRSTPHAWNKGIGTNKCTKCGYGASSSIHQVPAI